MVARRRRAPDEMGHDRHSLSAGAYTSRAPGIELKRRNDGPTVPRLGVSAMGIEPLTGTGLRKVGLFTLGALLTYPILVVFVAPVTQDLPRYFLPVAPLMVLATGRTFREWENRIEILWPMAALVLVILLASNPVVPVLRSSVVWSEQGYVFDEIVERDIVSKLFDTIAPRFEGRAGGYTRLLKVGNPKGTMSH